VSQILGKWDGPVTDFKESQPASSSPSSPSPSSSSSSSSSSSASVVYMVADSHSMAPGWQRLKITAADSNNNSNGNSNSNSSSSVLIIPKLVTGLKCWHLRPSCSFYPKRNFENVLESIPDKARVIFGFGEIDCREGILVAVAQNKYKDLAEGISVNVEVYIEALEEVVMAKNITAYVHPIVPVLDPTRETVKAFNKQLKRRVEASKFLTFLDFFDALLTEDGKDFNPKYALDGTHMSPSYAHLLEEALNKVW